MSWGWGRRNRSGRGGASIASAEEDGDRIAVLDMPFGRLAQEAGESEVGGQQGAIGVLLVEELLPAGSAGDGCDVLLDEGVAVKIVAVVDEDLEAGIETVDEVSAPGVGGEGAVLDVVCGEELGGCDGKVGGGELLVHELAAEESATIAGGDADSEDDKEDDEVASELGLKDGEFGGDGVAAGGKASDEAGAFGGGSGGGEDLSERAAESETDEDAGERDVTAGVEAGMGGE